MDSPKSIDHVALWVSNRRELSEFLLRHTTMHEIESTDTFSLIGSNAREGKLTLFDAPGARQRGALERIYLRVNDLDAARRLLPEDLEVHHRDHVLDFSAPGGVPLGFVQRSGLEYDLDRIVLSVSSSADATQSLSLFGLAEVADNEVAIKERSITLLPGKPRQSVRPMLNHIAILVESTDSWVAALSHLGHRPNTIKDAANTYAAFFDGPDGVQIELVEHKPEFALR